MVIHVDVSKFDELILLINNPVDEKQKRILLGKATVVYGRGGATHAKELTGSASSTLHSGNIEANSRDENVPARRIRRIEAGRKPFTEHHPDIIDAIEKIIDGQTYGNPSKVIHRIPQSMRLRKIEALLSNGYGIQISYVKVFQLLTDIGYSKQVDQKMLQADNPIISVNTENIGNIKNNAAEYRKSKAPAKCSITTFLLLNQAKSNHMEFMY